VRRLRYTGLDRYHKLQYPKLQMTLSHDRITVMKKRYCEIRRKLAEEFATAARLYGERVVSLASNISKRDYVRLCKMAHEAQDRSEAAFRAFEEHLKLHRCYDGGTDVRNTASLRRTA
jgi:hypothetical protein